MNMNWTGNKTTIAQVGKIKRKQIEKLKQQKYRVTELQRDVQYSVEFRLKKDNSTYCMIVDLPPNFPAVPPVVFIHPVCSHKFIDGAQQVVNFPPLDHFKKKPDLVSVINKLVAEFEKNPPLSLLEGYSLQSELELLAKYDESSADNNAESLLPGCSASEMLTNTLSRENSIITKKVQYTAPDIPEQFDELESLTSDELKEIITDESKVIDLFHSVEQTKTLVEDREKLSASIQKLATGNLSQSNALDEGRSQLVDSYSQCVTLQEKNKNLEEKYEREIDWFSPTNVAVLLKVEGAEADLKSEEIADSFLKGDLDSASFIKQFMDKKTLYYSRKTLEDKMNLIAKVS